VIPGANAPSQITDNLAHLRRDIPGAFWAELKAEKLLHAEAPTG